MVSLEQYLDDRLAQGRCYFSRDEALNALGIPARNFAAAARLINKSRLANPHHGFFLILRPEDKIIGAPDVELTLRGLIAGFNGVAVLAFFANDSRG